jgi:hypothetical protein
MRIVKEYTEDAYFEVIEIKSASYAGNFVIHIGFDDGVNQSVDFKPFISKTWHSVIRQYLDEAKFKQFAISDFF